MNDLVRYEKRDRVGVITIDNPPVNALSTGVPDAVISALKRGLEDGGVAVFVLIGAGRTFTAGADIREFGKPGDPKAATLRDLIAAFAGSDKPVIAAMHVNALGGGLEIALGCDYRIGAPGTRYGFPEVKIGLLPGAGGTQRAPRLIGVERALDMIVTGDFVDSRKALEFGLIDGEIEGDLLEGALAYAERLVSDGASLRRIGEAPAKARDLPGNYFDGYRKAISKKARGQLAPFLCIDSVELATKFPLGEGLERERALFETCLESPQSKALIHAFFSERETVKVPGLSKETPRLPIENAGVVGAGTMGGGIAMCFANAGIPVHVVEASEEVLQKGLAVVRENYERSVARGRLSPDEMARRLSRITGGVAFDALQEADIVIEAVFEEMKLKKEVFVKLDRLCQKDAILATNTSTLDVDEIARATSRPEKVIGTHFFSPANIMRLLEAVRGAKTAPETIATVMTLAKRLGKVPALVGVCDGFVGNRMLYTYLREASFLLEEGALPQQVDRVMADFGFPMGPFAMGDLAGLDVGYRIRQHQAATRPKHLRYSRIADRICEMGRFGQKTGGGWHRYEPGSRTPIPDPEIEALIVEESKELGMARRDITDQEIVERCIYPLINEGAKILEEGIALRPGDIDVIWLNGFGFPRWRGGPMYYADSIGAAVVLDAVGRYHDVHGAYWEPAPLLKRLAEEGKNFADLKISPA